MLWWSAPPSGIYRVTVTWLNLLWNLSSLAIKRTFRPMKSSYVALNVYIEKLWDYACGGSESMSQNNLQITQGCSNEFPAGKGIVPWGKLKSWGSHV